MMNLYAIRLNLEMDDASGIYTVTSPDVPGLITEGSTPAEIARNVQEALDCLREGWARHSLPLPPALEKPVTRPRHMKTLVMA
jgi:predicted RNase H-like HicB family nuclease